MSVHNLMEEIVRNCLKELQQTNEKFKQCNEQQLSDVLAITLNHVPPKYVSTLKGEVFAKTQLRAQVETDVYQELTRAIDIVFMHERPSDLDGE